MRKQEAILTGSATFDFTRVGAMSANYSAMDTLNALKLLPLYDGQASHVHQLPSREAVYADLEHPLPESLAAALQFRGIFKYFSHQATAINAAWRGDHGP